MGAKGRGRMRTNFTLEDVKGLVEKIYNGNLKQSRISGGSIPYENENSEKIAIYDEYGRSLGEKDIAEYLNLHFYTWRNRVVDSEAGKTFDLAPEGAIAAWVESLNGSLNDAYALVEITNTTAVASQDIDGAQITGRVTIIIQANKVANLDYYAGKIHNKYLGAPQDIVNSYGNTLKAFLNMGIILYDGEPVTMQLGECVTVSFNFTINYLSDAFSYADTEISFATFIDPDEEETAYTYEKLPITKASLVSLMTYSAVPFARRPDITGVINTAQSNTWTLAYLDFKQPLIEELDRVFWESGAIKTSADGGEIWDDNTITDLNIPFYAKVKVNYTTEPKGEMLYKYAFVITEMRKEIVNGDFTICSLTLRGRAKDQTLGEVTE